MKFASVRKINGKRFEKGITTESTVKFAKVAWTKSSTLVCVTRRMVRAYVNFKH